MHWWPASNTLFAIPPPHPSPVKGEGVASSMRETQRAAGIA